MNIKNLLLFSLSFIVFSCIEKEANTYTFGLLKGPSSIGMVQALEDLTYFNSKMVQYQSKDNPQHLRALVQSGNMDMAILPLTMAYSMIDNGVNIKIAAITGWGNLYLISRDSIQDFSELTGHCISVPGEAQTPDLVSKFLINYYNLNQKTSINYTYPAPILLTSALAVGKVDYAVLPEPLASIALAKDKNLKRSLSLADIWKEEIKRPLIQSVLVINEKTYTSNKKWFSAYFNIINKQVDSINAYPEKALELAHKHQLVPKKLNQASIIENSKLDFLYGKKIAGTITSYLHTFYPEMTEDEISRMLIFP